MSIIFAVDFDGTICEYKCPKIGKPNIEVINKIKELRKDGAKVILWTCRGKEDLKKAIRWCKKNHNLEFDAVNDDVEEVKTSKFGKTKSRKIFAHFYIDDRNMFFNLAQ